MPQKRSEKTKAKTLLADTTVSTRAVHQPRPAKRKSIWHNCISTARYINRDQPGKSILAQLCINSDHKTKAKAFWTTRPRRPERFINRDQQIESLDCTAIYKQRCISTASSQAKACLFQLCTNSDYNPKRKWCWTTQPCRSERVNRDQEIEILYGTAVAVYQLRGISIAISKSKAYMAQLYISSTVYQPRSARQKHICLSVSTAIRSQNASTSGQHSRVDPNGVSTAVSKAKAYKAQLCISRARNFNRHQRGISTTISKAKAYLAQRCINSDQKPERKQFWTTQPGPPERYINRDQLRERLYGTAVYQQRGISTAISEAKAYLSQLCINSD